MQRFLSLALTVTLAAMAAAGSKYEGKFAPGAASSYESKQTNGGVTIAVAPYDTEELARTAFGKVNPNQYGIVPVLLVIQNDSDQALRLGGMQVQFETANGGRIDATPASDVPYAAAHPNRRSPNIPSPIPPGLIKHKNPLAAPQIQERAFAAKMLPPHDSAHGFVYFQTHMRPGSQIYITGITQARSGKELFYYEIPLK